MERKEFSPVQREHLRQLMTRRTVVEQAIVDFVTYLRKEYDAVDWEVLDDLSCFVKPEAKAEQADAAV